MRRHELHPRTAAINKAQKLQSKKIRNEALAWLATTFPQAFDNSVKIRPLKIGIMEDVLESAEKAAQCGISKSKLREAVVLFTRRLDYLICLKAREMRIDLNGNPVDLVSEEEAEKAAIKIKKRIEKGMKISSKNSQDKNTKLKSNPEIENPITSFFPERMPAFSSQNASSQRSTVVVKHKTSRAFDPQAVARLKEKLGLSKAQKESAES